MKVINKLDTKDEKWFVGDVIEYGDHSYSERKHVMIIRIVKPEFAGQDYDNAKNHIRYSMVMLDGGFEGDIGAGHDNGWLTGATYSKLDFLQREFVRACVYAKKVPFYGVVGKPEED